MTTKQHEPPTPAAEGVGPPGIEVAARNVYHALVHIGPQRLGHGYGCPAEAGGPCTCGTADLIAAMQALGAAVAGLSTPTEPV
jgi:hypothetical protein